MQRRQFDPVRRQASVDIYGGTESATPATQIEPEVLKVSPVTRHAAAPIRPAKLPRTSMEVLKMPRLPRKSSLRLSRDMQRRQFDPVRRQASVDIYGGTESATPATQSEPEVPKVSRLSRDMQRRQFDPVRRQASADNGGSEGATPATRSEPLRR